MSLFQSVTVAVATVFGFKSPSRGNVTTVLSRTRDTANNVGNRANQSGAYLPPLIASTGLGAVFHSAPFQNFTLPCTSQQGCKTRRKDQIGVSQLPSSGHSIVPSQSQQYPKHDSHGQIEHPTVKPETDQRHQCACGGGDSNLKSEF